MRNITRSVALTTVVAVLYVVSVQPAAAEQATRGQVEGLLSGYEYMPTPKDLNRLGSGVAERLMEIATDPQASNLHKIRALKLLAHYADQAPVESFLDHFLDKHDQPLSYRRAALISLGSVPEGKSVERIATFLESHNAQVRSAAAQALAKTKNRHASALLKQAAASEKDDHLQKKMETIAASLEKEK
jgi:HEAT repeat protein